ncbi:cactin [Senna tora]|uniref:Cactin n=1 Tax=Senna tora TaxID=362788 RepID=A0A834TXL5_9FABA|nr:cactin [Senna tora]
MGSKSKRSFNKRRRSHRLHRSYSDNDHSCVYTKKRSSNSSTAIEEEITEYLARKLKTHLKDLFVWQKKIERDVSRGLPLDAYSLGAERKRHRERIEEIEEAKKSRERKALERAAKRYCFAPSDFQDEQQESKLRSEEDEYEFEMNAAEGDTDHHHQHEEEAMAASTRRAESNLRSEISKIEEDLQEDESDMQALEEDTDDYHQLRKPKYWNRVHTGYEWNKYNKIHYDHHDSPPPKSVRGYKFVIFYTDLEDNKKVPSYTIEKDGNNSETCILRFHGGSPYEDIAFRIVNKDWEYCGKKGFKCTFEGGILRLYFNFKRYRYRK